MNYNSLTLEQLYRISRDGDLDEFTKVILAKALDLEAELEAVREELENETHNNFLLRRENIRILEEAAQ
jgi:hypothetical protein